jgi:hypothetical protein
MVVEFLDQPFLTMQDVLRLVCGKAMDTDTDCAIVLAAVCAARGYELDESVSDLVRKCWSVPEYKQILDIR